MPMGSSGRAASNGTNGAKRCDGAGREGEKVHCTASSTRLRTEGF